MNDFDRKTLVPQLGVVGSRKDIEVRSFFSRSGNSKLYLDRPFISANMDTVAGPELVAAMKSNGATGFLHRYQSPEGVVRDIKYTGGIPTVGIQEQDLESAKKYREAGAEAICIDVAHGHSLLAGKMTTSLRRVFDHVIVGNIATKEGAIFLEEAGATGLKVGIGPGFVCTTRLQTGVGVPQLEAIEEVSGWSTLPVIADGGFRCPGHAVKAFGAGARAVMSGFFFAACKEAPGNGLYRGMASNDAQRDFRGSARNVEGRSTQVEVVTDVASVLNELTESLQSGISYCGYSDLEGFVGNGVFRNV